MLRLFRKKNKPGIDDIVQEKWEGKFASRKKRRFEEVREKLYESFFLNSSLHLNLKKKNLFAWVNDPYYQYRDCVIEFTFSISPENGHSSAGFLLRYINEENYYYFLISNRNKYRFDLVFNGNPLPLIPWTSCPDITDSEITGRIIAHGNNFYFFLDGSWIGEIEHDGIYSGKIGFGAQNYSEKEEAVFTLDSIIIESRPVSIETLFYRWTRFIEADPGQRIVFAESLYNQGKFHLAIVQLKKISRRRQLNEKEYLLLADCFSALEMYEESSESVEKILEQDPQNKNAVIGKANLFYLRNKLLEGKSFLESHGDLVGQSPVLENLFGNIEYALGDFTQAGEHYRKAFQMAEDMPIFAMNAGRAFERLHLIKEAIRYYVSAVEEYFRQEAYDDLNALIPQIKALDPENQAVRGIEGKMLFHEENFPEARSIFSSLIKEECGDSAVYYLQALIQLKKEEREEALSNLRRAAELEDDCVLYWMRIAECELSLSLNPEESIKRALALSPEDPWICNLAGQFRLENSDPEGAVDYLSIAHGKIPDNDEITINLSQAYFESGKIPEAFSLLPEDSPSAPILNQRGNLLSRQDDYKDALRTYEKAVNLDPDNQVYQENYAAVCLELDLLSRAEEVLVLLLDKEPSARTYSLLAETAWRKGEYSRAEEICKQGIQLYPEADELNLKKADLYRALGRWDEAWRILAELNSRTEDPRVQTLLKEVREKTEVRISCVLCGREWYVRKNISEQGPLKLRGELPDDSPAGSCPECGRVYCIGCVKDNAVGGKLLCPECGKTLKLSDNYLRYLVAGYADLREDEY